MIEWQSFNIPGQCTSIGCVAAADTQSKNAVFHARLAQHCRPQFFGVLPSDGHSNAGFVEGVNACGSIGVARRPAATNSSERLRIAVNVVVEPTDGKGSFSDGPGSVEGIEASV
jgi:hypothetical protein